MSNINWLSFSTSSSNLIPRKTLCVKTPTPLQICNNWTFCRFSREPSPLLAFPLSPLIFPHVEIGVLNGDKSQAARTHNGVFSWWAASGEVTIYADTHNLGIWSHGDSTYVAEAEADQRQAACLGSVRHHNKRCSVLFLRFFGNVCAAVPGVGRLSTMWSVSTPEVKIGSPSNCFTKFGASARLSPGDMGPVLCDLYHSIVVLNLYCGISTTMEWYWICTMESVPLWSGTESVLQNQYHNGVVLNLYYGISTTMEWYWICTVELVPLHSGTKLVLCDLYHSIVVLNLYCGISTTMELYWICTVELVPLHSGTKFVLCDLYHYGVVLNLYCGISTTPLWFSICTGWVWVGRWVGGWLGGWGWVCVCVYVCACVFLWLCACVFVCVCVCACVLRLRT